MCFTMSEVFVGLSHERVYSQTILDYHQFFFLKCLVLMIIYMLNESKQNFLGLNNEIWRIVQLYLNITCPETT
jgi:hypothetical protein